MIIERNIMTADQVQAEISRLGPGYRVLAWVFDDLRRDVYDQRIEIVEITYWNATFFYARLIPAQELIAFFWDRPRSFYFVKEQ